jgi:hypothetical protein
MKGPKLIGWIVLGLVALIVLTLVLIPVFISADRARQIAVNQIELRMKRPVAVGEAHIRVIPFRVDLGGIRIGGPNPAPNQPLLTIERLRIGVRLLPLLKKQIDVSSIQIDRPHVDMIISAEPPPPPQAPPARPAGSPMALRVQHLGINDGSVNVRLADGTPFARIAGLSENLSAGISTGGNIQVSGEAKVDTIRVQMTGVEIGQGIRLRLEHDVLYEQGRDLLTVKKGTLHVSEVPIQVTGTVSNVQSPEPVLDLALQGGPAQISEIVGLVPIRLMPAQAKDVRSSGTLSVNGVVHGTAKLADFNVNILLDNGRIEAPALLPAPVEGIRLDVHARPDTILVREFSAHAARTNVKGNVALVNYQRDPAFRLAADLDLDFGAISGLLVPPDSMKLTGETSVRLIAEGLTRAPQNARVDGVVHFTSVGASGRALPQPVTNANGDVVLQNQNVGLRGISLKIGSSDLALNGTLTNPLALMPPPKAGAPPTPPALVAPPGTRSRFDLRVRSGLLNLNEFMPPAGAAGQKTPQKPLMILLPPADGVINMACNRLLVQRIEAQNVNGRVIVDHGVIQFQNLGMNTLGGTVGLNGTLDLSAMATTMETGGAQKGGTAAGKGAPAQNVSPKIDLTATARNIAVGDLFALAPALDRFGHLAGFLTGALSANATMRGSLNDSLMVNAADLTSNGNLEIANAKLSNQPIQQALVGFLNVPQLNNVAIQDWKQAFTIEQGRINIKGLNIRAGDVELTASGWQALDGQTEMNIDMMLPKAFSQQIAAKLPPEVASILMSGSDARLYVPLTIRGRTVSPNVSLNSSQITDAAKRQAEARLNQEKARLVDEARRQAEGLLQKNLGKAGIGDSLTKGLLDSSNVKKNVLNRLGKIFGK